MDATTFFREAFDRNRWVISDEEQEMLRHATIAIPGMGWVWWVHSTSLARLWIGNFHIADFDTFAIANTNRQTWAMSSTMDKSKEDVMATIINDINPYIKIEKFGKITEENLDSFLEGVDIVVDGMDFFEIDVRRLIFKRAYEKWIPVITAWPIGFGSAVHIFTKDSMKFDDYFDIQDSMTTDEKIIQFGIGVSPSLLQRSYMPPKWLNLKWKRGPSTVAGTLAAANFSTTYVYKIITWKPYEGSPVSRQFDPYIWKIKRVNLWFGNRHPIQRIKRWYLSKILMK